MSEAWSEVKKSQLSNHHLEYLIDHISQYIMDATLLNVLTMIDRQFIMNTTPLSLCFWSVSYRFTSFRTDLHKWLSMLKIDIQYVTLVLNLNQSFVICIRRQFDILIELVCVSSKHRISFLLLLYGKQAGRSQWVC